MPLKGYARYNNAIFSIKSAGGDIGKRADAFCMVHQPISADADLVARLMDVGEEKKVGAGLMLRCGRDASAAYAGIFYVAGDLRFFKRDRPGESSDGGSVGTKIRLPLWLRLSRRGDLVAAMSSKDGTHWDQLVSDSLPAAPAAAEGSVQLGLAVCGRDEARLLGSHFDNVRLSVASTPVAAPAVPTSLKEGILLRNGTLLAGAQIAQADDGKIRFTKADRRDALLALGDVSRVLFRELPVEALAKIPPKRSGVLLKEGDFVEGEFKGIKDGRLLISSVLFGLAKFDMRDKAVALIVNDPEPARAATVVRTSDGSTYMADAIAVEKDRVTLDDALAGKFTLARSEIAELSAGAARLEPLAAVRPSHVEAPPGEGLSFDATAAGRPVALAGAPCERPLALTAGAAASWELAGKYRLFTFRAGVPTGILPTAAVRFIVLADGKELYRSPPRTSSDEPITSSVPLSGAHTLTLKIESTTTPALPTPAVWADASLAK
jgi:hypothetical protein